MNELCSHFKRCGKSGHFQDESGDWVRCRCLMQRRWRKLLGPFYCDEPNYESPLVKSRGADLRIEGAMNVLRPHLAAAVLVQHSERKTSVSMDAYRLIEIFLEKDAELANVSAAVDPDLLIVMLGFADPPNRYLPELMMQTFVRRDMLMKPTWVVLGIEMGAVSRKYNEQVYTHLAHMKKAVVK